MTSLITALLLGFAPISPDAPCVVSGAGTLADVSRAQAACETARSRFTALFGIDAPSAIVMLRDQSGYRTTASGATAVVHWATGTALTAHFGAGSAAQKQIDQQWTDVLPHEISHALMIAHFYAQGGASGHRGYGTPLADWFEEAVAIWAEPESSRTTRLAQARRLPRTRLDLEAILAGSHPAASNGIYLASRDGAPTSNSAALWAFYPQSYAVLAFVHAHGGTPAIAALTKRLDSDDGIELLLGLPGLPRERNDLLSAWERWLASR
jgi:hypothetical protein